MNLRALAVLTLCNFFWSLHPIWGKLALESFTPPQTAVLRYGTAAIAYLFLWSLVRTFAPKSRQWRLYPEPLSKRDAVLFGILGIAPFAISPILQLEGLDRAQSIDNAAIVAMEPIMTALLAWLVLREKISTRQFIAFATAIAGFALLSHGRFGVNALIPFLLMAMALWGEATYSVLGRKLTQRYEPLPLFGIAIVVGAIVLIFYAGIGGQLSPLPTGSGRSWLGIMALGPLGTTVGYMAWIYIARTVPVAAAALTIFIQPVLGTLFGIVFRNETFSSAQWIGALLILAAVGFQTREEIRLNVKSLPH